VVGDLVQDDVTDLVSEPFRVMACEALDWAAKDRDLVRERSGVAAGSSGERDAPVQAEQSLSGRRFFLHDDLDVRERRVQIGR
jgi:hypothetical protein